MARRRCSAPSAVLVRTFQISWVALAVAGLPATAWSQSAKSDKSEYTLLNPVPEDKLRSFSPDRPARSTNPYTVDAGHVQYETDFFNYTYQKTGPVRTTTWLGLNPRLKVGVTNEIDIEANIAPFENVETSDSVAGIASSISGVSDLFLRAKINLWGNGGGKTAGAIIAYLKAPTAPIGVGNGATEGGFIAPLAISLPGDASLALNTEIDILKDRAGGGYHTNYVNIAGISMPLVKDVTVTGEFWSSIPPPRSGNTAWMRPLPGR